MRTSASILCRMRPCPPGPDAVDGRGNGKALAWHSHRIKAVRSPLCKAGGRRAGRRRRHAALRTCRSVNIAPPNAGRGTECARPELSMRGACAARRQGS